MVRDEVLSRHTMDRHKTLKWIVLGLAAATGAVFLGVVTFARQGIGQDDAAILLAATELPTYHFWSPGDLQHNLLFRLFNYSHGWMNLVWTYVVYIALDTFGIPLATWALVLPSTLLIFGTAVLTYGIGREMGLRRRWAVLAAVFFLTMPIILGLARSYTIQLPVAMFARSFAYLLIIRALTRHSRRYHGAALFAIGLLIVSENAFPFPIALGVLLVAFVKRREITAGITGRWRRVRITARETIRFFLHPFSPIPIALLGWYVVAYVIEGSYPFGYGFFRYTSQHPIQFSIPFEFPTRFLDHFGFGISAALPLLAVGGVWILRRRSRFPPPLLTFIVLWAAVTITLPFIYWPNNAMIYSALAAPPFALLIAWILETIATRLRIAVYIGITFILIAQGVALVTVAFDVPYRGPNIYGASQGYRWSVPFKAVGAILRSEGYHPDRYRTKDPPPYDVAFAGAPTSMTVYPGVLYWGTYPLQALTEHARIIVTMMHNEDMAQRRSVLKYARQNGFGLRHVVYDAGQPVAWMYYRGYTELPESHDQSQLTREWDQRYASLKYIKVPGLAGPHAL